MFRNSQKHLAVACAMAIGIVAAPAEAQVTATMVLKNGQRHTGQNLGYRVDGREVAVRTSFQEEPRVAVDQVAYVDYGGSPDVNPNLSGSEEAVVLRDGTIIKGQVISLGHDNRNDQTTPYLVIIKPSNGDERRLPVNQVARVYFSGSNAVPPTGSTGQVPAGEGIAVPANQQWTPTGINVRRGEVLTFSTTGEVRLSSDPADMAGSAGARSQRYAQGSPLPANFAGALIARVGNGAPFPIGNQTTVTMPAAGQLFLGINDDNVGDNDGGFRVNVRQSGRRR